MPKPLKDMMTCPTCNGSGWVYPERAKIENGKTVTVQNQEPCPQCGCSGVVER